MKESTRNQIVLTVALWCLGRWLNDNRPKRSPGAGSTPGAPGSARERWDPLGVKSKTAAAIASGDTTRMRELAAVLRKEGYASEAAELEAAAAVTR